MCPHKVIVILAAACLPLGAQTVIHSSITGRVLDPASAPVPNVKLTATVAPGGIEHQAATDDQGIYQFPRLTPGQARLDASADAEFSSPAYLYSAGASPSSGYQGGVVGGRRPIAADFSHSELEAPHVFTFSGVYDLPLGRRWPRMLGGWSVSPVLLFRTGNTFNVTTGMDYNDDGVFDDRPALFAGSTLGDLRFTAGDKTQFLAPINQATTMLGTPATVNDPSLAIPRNAFRAPAIYNVDVSLAKRVAITEHTAARFELNAFNVFNRPHLGIPSRTLTSAFFGQITSTLPAMNPRQVQLGAKLTF